MNIDDVFVLFQMLSSTYMCIILIQQNQFIIVTGSLKGDIPGPLEVVPWLTTQRTVFPPPG